MRVASLLLLSAYDSVTAFAPLSLGTRSGTTVSVTGGNEHDATLLDRRYLFKNAAVLASGFSLLTPTAARGEVGGIGNDPDHPIVVIGAGGKTGKLCTEILANKNLYTKAVTRNGREVLESPSSVVSYGSGDVTSYESIKSAISGASGVIFAASSSGKKKGGDPAHVDYLGVYNTAKACIEGGVPKLVVVSAGTVTRPDSVGFKATNLFVKYVYGENIMGYKIAGEAIMRDLYDKAPAGVAYTVVRPGGLGDKASKGASFVHVSQGDVYSSEIAREDVAQVCVAALLKGKDTDNTTFELNQIEGLGKAQGNLPDLPKELVHVNAPSYDQLLTGLKNDNEMKSKYPDLISGFRGDKIEPIDQLV